MERVSGIRTALETGYNIIIRGENIHHLTFTLVAPLQTEYHIDFFHSVESVCFCVGKIMLFGSNEAFLAIVIINIFSTRIFA
jgi:hypothetical protein